MLQVMHIIWFKYILRRAYLVFFKGGAIRDDRSMSNYGVDINDGEEEKKKSK